MFAQHVPASVLTYTPGLPSFLSLTQSILGNAGDPSDGFESAYNPVAASLPANDAGYTASDAGFDDLATSMSGFVDSGLDDIATELGQAVAGFNPGENAFYGAIQSLSNLPAIPASPSDVSIPDFNVSTGIPAPPSLPNPPVTPPPPTPPPPPPPPLPPSIPIAYPTGGCFTSTQTGQPVCNPEGDNVVCYGPYMLPYDCNIGFTNPCFFGGENLNTGENTCG